MISTPCDQALCIVMLKVTSQSCVIVTITIIVTHAIVFIVGSYTMVGFVSFCFSNVKDKLNVLGVQLRSKENSSN